MVSYFDAFQCRQSNFYQHRVTQEQHEDDGKNGKVFVVSLLDLTFPTACQTYDQPRKQDGDNNQGHDKCKEDLFQVKGAGRRKKLKKSGNL